MRMHARMRLRLCMRRRIHMHARECTSQSASLGRAHPLRMRSSSALTVMMGTPRAAAASSYSAATSVISSRLSDGYAMT
jgi:hypothetical protein